MRTLSPYNSYAMVIGGMWSPEQVMGYVRFTLAKQAYLSEVKESPMEASIPDGMLQGFEKYLRDDEPHALADLYTWKANGKFSQKLWMAFQGFQSKAVFNSSLQDLDPDAHAPQKTRSGRSVRRSSLNLFRAKG